MTTTIEQVYLLGGEPRERFRFRLRVTNLRKRSEIHRAILQAPKQSCAWIATRSNATDDLLREVFTSGQPRTSFRPRLGRLLLLFPPRFDSLPALEELFDPVAWGTAALRLLAHEELAEVLGAENRRDLLIGGFVDPRTNTLMVYRGDFTRLAVPLSLFKALGTGPRPNPSALSFTDFGQTVCLGHYQAAADAILYEADSDYRRRINAKRRQEDRSFGASLRRLRVLKGLRQSDFNSIPARTIARIERGEVGKPHRDTVEKIAKYLRIEPDDIEAY
jgi:Helix-turn-helix